MRVIALQCVPPAGRDGPPTRLGPAASDRSHSLRAVLCIPCQPQEVVQGLRQQVAVARELKQEAAPEWQDKISKLQELKEIRKSYLDEIAAIKTAQTGLEARSEVGGRLGWVCWCSW